MTDKAFEVPPASISADERALREWNRLAPALTRGRVVTDADRAALIAVCQQWSIYEQAIERIQADGLTVKSPNGYQIPSPFLPIANKALVNCVKLWTELGCTPSSRTRVAVTGPEQAADPLEAALSAPEGYAAH